MDTNGGCFSQLLHGNTSIILFCKRSYIIHAAVVTIGDYRIWDRVHCSVSHMINTVPLRSRIVLLMLEMPYIYALPRKREQFYVHLHSAVIHVSLVTHSVLPNVKLFLLCPTDTRDEKNWSRGAETPFKVRLRDKRRLFILLTGVEQRNLIVRRKGN